MRPFARSTLPLCASLALAACAAEPREPTPTTATAPRTIADLEVATPLAIDLVFARDAIWLYARDPTAEPACREVIFPDAGVCATWSDVPCDAHLLGPSLAPCLARAELVVRATGERLAFDTHGGLSGVAPFTFDPYRDALSLHLDGCGMSATLELPRPTAEPPAVEALEREDDALFCTLDRSVPGVMHEAYGLVGTVCGTPASDEVRLIPQPGATVSFGAAAPLGAFEAPFGALRVWQWFSPVRDIVTVPRVRDAPVALPIVDERYFAFGALESMVLDVDDALEVTFVAGADDNIARTRITLTRTTHTIARDFPDGRRLRAVLPARTRGGGIGALEAFSLFWRERVMFEDTSGMTPPAEQLVWFDFDPGVAVIALE